MGKAVFPPCYSTWGQPMVEVMEIMVTSFKMSHTHTATLSAPSPAAGHHQPMPPPETPGHSQASLGQVCLCHPKVCPQSCVTSGGSMVGIMAVSSKRAYAIPRSAAPRAPAPVTVHCWPVPQQEILKHSSVSVSVGSLGPGVHKVCLSLWASLAEMGFDSKCNFTPFTVFLGFSFALGCGVSPQSGSSTAGLPPSTYHLAGASLPLDMGYLLYTSQ